MAYACAPCGILGGVPLHLQCEAHQYKKEGHWCKSAQVFFGMFLSTTQRGSLSVGQDVLVTAAHEPGYRPVKLPAAA